MRNRTSRERRAMFAAMATAGVSLGNYADEVPSWVGKPVQVQQPEPPTGESVKGLDEYISKVGIRQEKKIPGSVRMTDDMLFEPVQLVVRGNRRKEFSLKSDKIELKLVDGVLRVTTNEGVSFIPLPEGDYIYLNNLRRQTINDLKDNVRLNEFDLNNDERSLIKRLVKKNEV